MQQVFLKIFLQNFFVSIKKNKEAAAEKQRLLGVMRSLEGANDLMTLMRDWLG